MELYTSNLLLRTVTDKDIGEVARMWKFEKGSISLAEAQNAIEDMQNNHNKNEYGYLHHLCLAVYEKGKNNIIGWCGLDGQCEPGKIEIFYLIDKVYRNKGYATQCANRLLEYAFEDAGLNSIQGGCYKDNLASYKVLEKIGMTQIGIKENGDPLFTLDKNTFLKLRQSSIA